MILFQINCFWLICRLTNYKQLSSTEAYIKSSASTCKLNTWVLFFPYTGHNTNYIQESRWPAKCDNHHITQDRSLPSLSSIKWMRKKPQIYKHHDKWAVEERSPAAEGSVWGLSGCFRRLQGGLYNTVHLRKHICKVNHPYEKAAKLFFLPFLGLVWL